MDTTKEQLHQFVKHYIDGNEELATASFKSYTENRTAELIQQHVVDTQHFS